MFNIIFKLQKKPERVKKQIAFFGAAALTALIVIFWLISVANTEKISASDIKDENGPIESLTKSLSIFFEDAGSVIKETAGLIKELKNVENEGGQKTAPVSNH